MNLCNIRVVKDLMARYGTDTKKSFGQNFLINPMVPENIADESYGYHRERNYGKESAALEIGPGIGALTCQLCERYDKVVAVEIDRTLIPILDETLAEYNNIKVVNEDFMKLDLKSFVNENFGDTPVSVCANLPYYITTPIIMKLLEESRVDGRSMFTSLTVMVQKEVADRLCATEKNSDYGAITASINYYGTVKKLFTVAPGNFLPAPNVTSAVIRIELYEKNPYTVKSEKMLFDTIQGAFAQRRKTMLNSLSSSMSFVSKERIGQIINEIGFDANIRGEKLSISDFCALADKLYEEKYK
ncbi:MAG: 16S rRNA (adenine(1518)-N(6)/adenine(1519)-N(6))-dimethyltransferase RsmA [Clostridia bacterium]|nr:16S rRNA (adenine(1518)-N(6)/adenine(1519)-N(6))-dimethyltransferase RsmA [Clostridia bacterium]